MRYRNFLHNFAGKIFSAGWSILVMKTGRNSRCWVKWAFRLSLGCLYRRYSVFYKPRILSIVIRCDLGIMYYLSKILIRILPWDPWLPRCSENLARSCQDSQDAIKRVNPGFHKKSNRPLQFWVIISKVRVGLWYLCSGITFLKAY